MTTSPSTSPVSLSYVAAQRGVKPRTPGQAFTYALIDCGDVNAFIGLAASNPEGQFYGFIRDSVACVAAWEQARQREVVNVRFTSAAPQDILSRFGNDTAFLPKLDYLVCDESEQPLSDDDRSALYDFAADALQPNGLFSIGYQVNSDVESTLRFLVREFAPEMNAGQAQEFLLELKKLGKLYFADNKEQALALDRAFTNKIPDEFFESFNKGEARSKTFDTIVALCPRGFVYAGDGHIPSNYVELAVPQEAHEIIVGCRNNPLYEAIKDFTLNRTIRRDIWCRQTATMSHNPIVLFGAFSYGITQSLESVPSEFKSEGKTIDLSSGLFRTLIELMAMMPVSIGDILVYPACKDFAASDVVEAIQILVACGIVRPMRGLSVSDPEALGSIAQPRFVGAYNQYLSKNFVAGEGLQLSSTILGDVIRISPRDALVMKALDSAGLANSIAALLPELQGLAKRPEASAKIMDVAEPTEEIAHQMVDDVVTQSIVRWYAYGLLEAA